MHDCQVGIQVVGMGWACAGKIQLYISALKNDF